MTERDERRARLAELSKHYTKLSGSLSVESEAHARESQVCADDISAELSASKRDREALAEAREGMPVWQSKPTGAGGWYWLLDEDGQATGPHWVWPGPPGKWCTDSPATLVIPTGYMVAGPLSAPTPGER